MTLPKNIKGLPRKEYYRQYYSKNREKILKQKRRQRQRDPEKIRERRAKYRERNREKLREYQRLWRERNREKMREYQRLWRKNNPEKIKALLKRNRPRRLEWQREYYREHRDDILERYRRYRKKHMGKYRERQRRKRRKIRQTWFGSTEPQYLREDKIARGNKAEEVALKLLAKIGFKKIIHLPTFLESPYFPFDIYAEKDNSKYLFEVTSATTKTILAKKRRKIKGLLDLLGCHHYFFIFISPDSKRYYLEEINLTHIPSNVYLTLTKIRSAQKI